MLMQTRVITRDQILFRSAVRLKCVGTEMLLKLKHTWCYVRNIGTLNPHANVGWGSVDNFMWLKTKKKELCWLNKFNFTPQARCRIFKQRKLCVCVYRVLDCWNTGICFWPVPIKIRFDTTISSSNVPATQTEIHWYMYLRERSRETE